MSAGGTLNDPLLQDVLVTPKQQPQSKDHQEDDQHQHQMRLIENIWALYQERRFLEKRDELERMQRNMRDACLELERLDTRIFKMAMVKPAGEYFPIDRRIFVDTPAANGWNHSNEVTSSSSTAASSSTPLVKPLDENKIN